MCTGVEPYLLAASVAATAAGTASQISANKKVRRASENAAFQELQRKQKVSDEANQLFQAELQNSNVGDANKDVDQAAAEQLAEAKALTQRDDTGFTGGTDTNAAMASATPIVKEVAARQLGDELAKAEGQMKARAMLQGFKQRQIQRGTQFGRAADRMKLLQGFNQGWSQVGQTQQALAKNAGANQAMLGDALVGLGSIGMQAYGAGYGSGGAAAKTAATPASYEAGAWLNNTSSAGPGLFSSVR